MSSETADRREVVEQRGLWFDELRRDVVYRHSPGRTITEADNVVFTTLTMNPQALHLDRTFAAATEFGEPLVNSLLTLSMTVGLSVAQLTQGTIVANLGFEAVEFPAPVRHGDTIRVETVVLETRESRSRPGQGVATFEHTAYNQDRLVVARVIRKTLMHCQPVGDASSTSVTGTKA